MKKYKVVIQGIEGSFHHIAADRYFKEEICPVSAETFIELVDITLNNDKSDYGIMAIENSIAGSLLQNYGLLQDSGLKVEGEVYINIKQHLLALAGQKIEDIKEIHSHPMALQQCRIFLKENLSHVRLVESIDTALSAKIIAEKKLKNTAAIASKKAAAIFGLEVLQEGIESIKKNQTRFFILSPNGKKRTRFDKASIYFSTNHKVGSLYKVLRKISLQNINLSKLQSFPFPGKNWQYFFHADLEFDTETQYYNAIAAMKEFTEKLEVLGVYQRGKRTTE